MNNFFGFQGGNTNENTNNTTGNSSIFSKLTNVVKDVKLSFTNYSDLTNIELCRRGNEMLSSGQFDKAYKFFIEGAHRLDAPCMLRLYEMYAYGKGVAQDMTQAWFWARLCADNGDGYGDYLTGLCYMNGQGISQNKKLAWAYFDRAVRRGCCEAQQVYNQLYDELADSSASISKGSAANQKGLDFARSGQDISAIYWFRRSAKLENKYGYWNLASMYMVGQGVLADYEQAIYYFEKAKEAGHESADKLIKFLKNRMALTPQQQKDKAMEAVMVGQDSYNMVDYSMQFTYYKLAADNGHVDANCQTGYAYFYGRGTEINYENALYYLGKTLLLYAAHGTEPFGLEYYCLSSMYALGKGVNKDENKASYYFNLFKKFTSQDVPYNTVNEYMNARYTSIKNSNAYEEAEACKEGRYGYRDMARAIHCYDFCVNSTHISSCCELIWIYATGIGVPVDLNKALHYIDVAKNTVNNSPNPRAAAMIYRSSIAGLVLHLYNWYHIASYDFLEMSKVTGLCKRFYRNGLIEYARICAEGAVEMGCENINNIWNELVEEARQKAEEAEKEKKAKSEAEATKNNVSVEQETAVVPEQEGSIIIDDSAIFGYSDYSDWTPYEDIKYLVNNLNLTEIHPLDNKLALAPITENGPFDEEISKIRELEAAEDFDGLFELGYMYDEAASEENISVDELDKNLRLMILCYKIAATHGHPIAICMIAEAFRNGRGLPFDIQTTIKIFDKLGDFIRENVMENFDDIYECAKSSVEMEAGEYQKYIDKYVDCFDRYAYYLEKSHYPEERWLINEYYRRAHEKKNKGQIAPILFYRNLYSGLRVDWNQVLAMPWDNIVSAKYNLDSDIAVGQFETSEQDTMPENLDKYFAGMIGMEPVKEQLEKIYQAVKMQILRNKILEERGEEVVDSGKGYNFILLGNPGTGKTTVARIIARILYDINIRQNNSFIEIERSGVISDHVGGTEKRMREILEKVDGGTLFIDEAYSLYKEESDNDFGREAIDVLMKDMEDKRNSYSVIMAGYREPMLNMIKNANTGFSSRFTYTIELPDYSDESLIEIAYTHIAKQKFVADDKVDLAIKKCIAHDKIDHTFGNARYIRELVNRAIENQSHRLTNQGTYENEELFLLKAEDFWQGEYEEEGVDKYLHQLNNLIGLSSVKQEVESLINLITVQQEMERRGMESSMDLGTLHMAFKGNPGTGKTTVARIIGKLYASLGILKRGDVFVECTRADLVGKFQGHTAANVKKVVESAMGGILFIDEAYSLCQNENDSFGHEAVDALVAEIENNRKNFVVIFAGYTDDIDQFFKTNSGLRSRVPKDLIFEDYNLDELCSIAYAMLASKKLVLTEDAKETLKCCIEDNYTKADFGNARGVRNIIDSITRKQNVRIAGMLKNNPTDITNEVLLTIEASDIFDISV